MGGIHTGVKKQGVRIQIAKLLVRDLRLQMEKICVLTVYGKFGVLNPMNLKMANLIQTAPYCGAVCIFYTKTLFYASTVFRY